MNLTSESIDKALSDNCFTPFLQPIIDSDDGCCIGAEVLSRIVFKKNELLLPDTFIEYVLGDAKREIQLFHMMLNKSMCLYDLMIPNDNFFLSFNITANILDDSIFSSLNEVLKNKLPGTIVLEIIENLPFIGVKQDVNDAIDFLKLSGIKIALDDYGTGCSSLSLINDLEIDILKVPRNFISNKSVKSSLILDNIKHLSEVMNFEVIVEGVETTEELVFLKRKGFKNIQGYVYSPPLSMDDFTAFYKSLSGRDNEKIT